jgi:DNA (cytosine-5)-methyltransferase 1
VDGNHAARKKGDDGMQTTTGCGFTFLDTFAGIGGFRLALESLGGKCVLSSEIDPTACVTYEANFGERPSGDIRRIMDGDVPDHDILCGGFCCQTFSLAGKKTGFSDETRGTLFFEIARIAAAKRPAAVFLENVPHLLRHDGGNTFAVIRRTLEGIGYVVHYAVLDAGMYGIPTARKRTFIVAIRAHSGAAGRFRFPEPMLTPVRLADVLLPDSETNKYVVRNHPIHIDGDALARATGSAPLRTVPVGQVGDGKPRQGYRVYSPQGLAVTFLRRGGGVGAQTGLYYVNGRVRRLHPKEMARCMGFPDEFVIPACVSYEHVRRQFGNSVVVPLVRLIGERILAALSIPTPVVPSPGAEIDPRECVPAATHASP